MSKQGDSKQGDRQTAAPFRGVGVALVTLFRAEGALDAAATADLALRLVELGVEAVLAAGTTGEASALEPAERVELLRVLRDGLGEGGVPLIAGTGAPSSRQAVRLTEEAVGEGVDALLVLSPPGATDPRGYYDEVAKAAAGVPLLAYHYPAVSPPGIDQRRLAELPVAGCKDSSGDAERLVATLASWGGALYTGAAQLTLTAGALGAAGAILALANAEPERCVSAFAGDGRSQLELGAAHAEARAGFPSGIKALVSRRFGTASRARLAG
ncbi:MAG: dihydrodipicolinate synthase family protein [Acidimicrobiales bacterium]